MLDRNLRGWSEEGVTWGIARSSDGSRVSRARRRRVVRLVSLSPSWRPELSRQVWTVMRRWRPITRFRAPCGGWGLGHPGKTELARWRHPSCGRGYHGIRARMRPRPRRFVRRESRSWQLGVERQGRPPAAASCPAPLRWGHPQSSGAGVWAGRPRPRRQSFLGRLASPPSGQGVLLLEYEVRLVSQIAAGPATVGLEGTNRLSLE
jgi:hypothetical protein